MYLKQELKRAVNALVLDLLGCVFLTSYSDTSSRLVVV